MFRTALCVPSACSSTSLRLYSFHDIKKYSGCSQGSQHLAWSRSRFGPQHLHKPSAWQKGTHHRSRDFMMACEVFEQQPFAHASYTRYAHLGQPPTTFPDGVRAVE
jgi:hypothetical protein